MRSGLGGQQLGQQPRIIDRSENRARRSGSADPCLPRRQRRLGREVVAAVHGEHSCPQASMSPQVPAHRQNPPRRSARPRRTGCYTGHASTAPDRRPRGPPARPATPPTRRTPQLGDRIDQASLSGPGRMRATAVRTRHGARQASFSATIPHRGHGPPPPRPRHVVWARLVGIGCCSASAQQRAQPLAQRVLHRSCPG